MSGDCEEKWYREQKDFTCPNIDKTFLILDRQKYVVHMLVRSTDRQMIQYKTLVRIIYPPMSRCFSVIY